MHKDARNQVRESPAFTLRTAEKGVRQEYHNGAHLKKNTPGRLPLRSVLRSRASLPLETKVSSVLLMLHLYNINIAVSCPQRFALSF